MHDAPEWPMRINKYLAWKGFSTRRGADELIARGKVFINDAPALLGMKVEKNDRVTVKGVKDAREYRYFAYYKPRGLVTAATEDGMDDIMRTVKIPGVFPVGRLDRSAQGLMILTDDPRLADKLLSPERGHEREYMVRTKEKLRANFKEKMEKGVDIEGYVTKPCRVTITGEDTFTIVMTEGKKHQIRRMCVALFQEVRDMKRVRIATVSLAGLTPGAYRELTGSERGAFLAAVGL